MDNQYRKSNEMREQLKAVTPGGAQTLSKMAARFPVGAYPVVLRSGDGAEVDDVDGNRYVDWICGLGANTLGHNRPEVNAAVAIAINEGGPSFSLAHERELRVAQMLSEWIPCAEMVRFVKTGSEAAEAAIRTARIATGRDIILTVGSGYHCYAEGTEVLTIDGFRMLDDVSIGDLVATRNPITRGLEYQPVEEVFAYPFDGMAAQYKAQGIDLLVTADHRMMTATGNEEIVEYTARDLSTAKIPVAGHSAWNGKTPSKMVIPTVPPWSPGPRKISVSERHEIINSSLGHSELARRYGVSHSAIRKVRAQEPMKSTSKGVIEFDPGLFAEFLGYFLSEGFCLKHASRPRYEIHLCQNKGNIKSRMFDVVREMGFTPSENKTGISFASRELWSYLMMCGHGAKNKRIPSDIKSWGINELNILLSAMIDGDGTRSGGRLAYYTTSRQLADDVCEIALKIGHRATVKKHSNNGGEFIVGRKVKSRNPIYHVRLSSDTSAQERTAERKWVRYSGMVRCVRTVNGSLYVRRNGFPAWCGNSWHSWFQAVKPWHPGVPMEMEHLVKSFEYNNLESLRTQLVIWGRRTAAVIMEPCLFDVPAPDYLQGVRKLCDRFGALLIFDEVVTGFRWHKQGAQAFFGVTPDLATFGKGCANGYPISFLCGRADIMKHAELISGTFGGDTVALAACEATLRIYGDENICGRMFDGGHQLRRAFMPGAYPDLRCALDGYACKPRIKFTYTENDIVKIRDVAHPKNAVCMSLFLQETAKRGVLLHPGGFNVSAALTQVLIDRTVSAIQRSLEIVEAAVKYDDWSGLDGDVIVPVVNVRKS